MNSVFQEQIIHHIEKKEQFLNFTMRVLVFYKVKFVQKKILSLRNHIRN